jgi:hypothetical protein
LLILLELLAVRLPLMVEVAGDAGLEWERMCRALGRGDTAEGWPSPADFPAKVSTTSNFPFRFVGVPRSGSAASPASGKDGHEGDFVGVVCIVSAGYGLRTAGR